VPLRAAETAAPRFGSLHNPRPIIWHNWVVTNGVRSQPSISLLTPTSHPTRHRSPTRCVGQGVSA